MEVTLRLSAQVIQIFNTVNSYVIGNQWSVQAGNPNTLYFQLVDLDQQVAGSLIQNPGAQIFGLFNTSSLAPISPPLRYVLGATSGLTPYSVSVTFPSIDDAKVVTIACTQASPSDASIWQFNIPNTITPMSGDVQFSVTQGSMTWTFSVLQMIAVSYTNDGSDGTLPNNFTYYFFD